MVLKQSLLRTAIYGLCQLGAVNLFAQYDGKEPKTVPQIRGVEGLNFNVDITKCPQARGLPCRSARGHGQLST